MDRREDDRSFRRAMIWMVCLFALITVSIIACSEGHARPGPQYANANPQIKKWFKDQYNANNQWCCDASDGHPFYDTYTLDSNGDVEFDSDGQHYHLPAYMVLKGPNPTGAAVWWFLDTAAGRSSYCFALGAEG